MSQPFDQTSFNLTTAQTLATHTEMLETIVKNTAALPSLKAKVDKHDANLRLINKVATVLGFGIISTLFAFIKSKFIGSHS